MAIFGVSYLMIPAMSLTLNLMVTSVGSVNFIREKHARWQLVLPFLITSVPLSYVGGSLKLPREAFYLVLLISLLFVAVRIFCWKDKKLESQLGNAQRIALSLFLGAILGFIAGVVGIGGGIYLVPLIIIFGLGTPKQAAATGAIFIWVNSLAGLIARIQHHSIDVAELILPVICVLVGGFLGSHFGSSKLSPRTMQKILGVLILVAIVFLVHKLVAG